MSFSAQYTRLQRYFEDELNLFLSSLDNSNGVVESIKYAVTDGGKRIRPILCLATAEMLGIDKASVINYAIAIELIHSYSLVHDDLPCMDNDDYRRGKFSTHKQFGEDVAVLCGDALLNLSVECCLSKQNLSLYDFNAMRVLYDCAGYKGMIGGQFLDVKNEKENITSENLLYTIHHNKTAKLIIAPLLIASVMAGNKYYNELQALGYNLGMLFQIKDDILDVEGDFALMGKTLNKDEKSDKLTFVKLFDLNGAKKKAQEHYLKCKEILSTIQESEFLLNITEKIFSRKE